MRKVLVFLGLVVAVAGFFRLGLLGSKRFLSPPEIMGGWVLQSDGSGERLYYLSSQWEKRISRVGGTRFSSSKKTTSWLNIDLWALDAATAQPVFRKRLKKDKINADMAAMGVEQGILWARIPELVGIRLSDGVIVADGPKIEARNPTLAGLVPKPQQAGTFLPDSMQPLKFDRAAGMVVQLNDARQVRIDPLTLEATPYAEDAGAPEEVTAEREVERKAVVRISNGMDWYAMVRGQTMERPDDDLDWLGLLAESELTQAKTVKAVSHQMDFTVPRRHLLYRARMDAYKTDFGTAYYFVDPEVLPEGPEFLMGGLLTAGPGSYEKQPALWRSDPDSVFVLSRDKLGDEGRLQVSRISGPAGKPVWTTVLPLSNMNAWLPGEDHAMMLGTDPSAEHSPMAEQGENPAMQIVAIDLKTGELKTFNPDVHRDWPAEDLTGEKP